MFSSDSKMDSRKKKKKKKKKAGAIANTGSSLSTTEYRGKSSTISVHHKPKRSRAS